MPSSQSPNMGLFLPVPGSTPGPQWASENTANQSTIDTHDHTTGKGVRIPTAALNINADLALNSSGLVGASYASYIDSLLTANLTVNASMGNVAGQPYWRDSAGVVKKILLTGDAATSAVFTSVANGLAPASGGGSTNYLRADGSWAVPPGTGITALTGDGTASGTGSAAFTNVNAPSGFTHAGSILTTAIVAPGTPAAGKAIQYVDSTSKNFASKDDAGNINHGVRTQSATASNWIRAIADNGSVTISQPAFTDLTGSATTAQLGTNTATNAVLAQMATLTIKGNNTGGTANAADLTVAQVNAILPVFTSVLNGLVPASGGGTVNYLRADGTWQPASGGSGITALTGDVTASGTGSVAATLANIPTNVPAAGSILFTAIVAPGTPAAGKASVYVDSTSKNFAVKNDAGTVNHGVQTQTATASNWIRAIADNGSVTISQPAFTDISGTVPNSQLATMATLTIKGNNTGGTAAPTDLTATQVTAMLNAFTTSLKGLVPASGGGTTNFLRADGTFAAPGAGTLTGFSLLQRSYLTAGTSQAVTSGCVRATVTMVGGGGGGGGVAAATSGQNTCAGGGAPGSFVYVDTVVIPGANWTFGLGAGGSAGASGGGTGGTGGDTTFSNGTTTWTANGGGGGSFQSTSASAKVAAAGSRTTPAAGTIVSRGGAPSDGMGMGAGASPVYGGRGGDSIFGGAGKDVWAVSGGGGGSDATGFGSGGGGSCSCSAGTAQIGGAGKQGIIILDEWGHT